MLSLIVVQLLDAIVDQKLLKDVLAPVSILDRRLKKI